MCFGTWKKGKGLGHFFFGVECSGSGADASLLARGEGSGRAGKSGDKSELHDLVCCLDVLRGVAMQCCELCYEGRSEKAFCGGGSAFFFIDESVIMRVTRDAVVDCRPQSTMTMMLMMTSTTQALCELNR